MMFAQSNLDAAPAEFLKWFCVVVASIILVAAAAWTAFGRREKTSVKIDREDQPVDVRKAAKRYNHDLMEQRYLDHERRLQELEIWRNGLISKLDDDKEEILNAGAERELRLRKELSDLPGKIVVDILNAQRLRRGQ